MEVGAFADALVFEYPVDDNSSLIIRFESGIHGLLNFSCALPNVGNTLEICRTKGTITWPIFVWQDSLTVRVDHTDKEVQEYRFETDKVSQRVPMIKHFVECVNMKKESALPGIEGLKDQQVVSSAYKSSKTRRVVAVSDFKRQ